MIHRNLSIEQQVEEVRKVLHHKLLVGAAVGTSKGFEERVEALVNVGIPVILVDSAHGYATHVINAIKFIKSHFPEVDVIGGNVATLDGTKALIDAGADGIRVGMGPGAICTTRVISGMGVPQVTALLEASVEGKKAGVPIIADGGIKYSGDMVKALALGSSTVMMGSIFASSSESPGEKVMLKKEHIPARFKSILEDAKEEYQFKEYRGMGSVGAMEKGSKIKSEGEFHGKDYSDRVLVAEGVEGLVPVKGSVEEIVDQALGGIRSGMYYTGAKNLNDLWEKAKFIQITQASLSESHPHDVLITNPGENY